MIFGLNLGPLKKNNAGHSMMKCRLCPSGIEMVRRPNAVYRIKIVLNSYSSVYLNGIVGLYFCFEIGNSIRSSKARCWFTQNALGCDRHENIFKNVNELYLFQLIS